MPPSTPPFWTKFLPKFGPKFGKNLGQNLAKFWAKKGIGKSTNIKIKTDDNNTNNLRVYV